MRRLEVGGLVLELDDAQVADLRRQLGVERSGGLVDLKTAAGMLGVSRDFLYDHAADYGGEKHGGRWRFDPTRLSARAETPAPKSAAAKPRRNRKQRQKTERLLVARRGRS